MEYDKPKLEINFEDRYLGVEMSHRDKLLFMLLSVNQALITAVVSPVIIRPKEIPEVVADMYWDCLDDEDKANEIMQKRATLFGEDIYKHMQTFHNLSWFIHQINEGLQNGNYKTDVIIALAKDIKDYGTFVEKHQRREGHFIEYPYTPSGHHEVFRDTSICIPLSFNPERSLVGLKIDSYLLHIAAIDENIKAPEKSDLFDSFAKATSDLEERLERTEELLDITTLRITTIKV